MNKIIPVKSKEDFLKERIPDFKDLENYSDNVIRSNVLIAMELYADHVAGRKDAPGEKDEAIEFAGFLNENLFPIIGGKWTTGIMGKEYTTEDAYKMFKEKK